MNLTRFALVPPRKKSNVTQDNVTQVNFTPEFYSHVSRRCGGWFWSDRHRKGHPRTFCPELFHIDLLHFGGCLCGRCKDLFTTDVKGNESGDLRGRGLA